MRKSIWRAMSSVTMLALAMFGLQALADSVKITGAGATFPYPLYSRWAADYKHVSGVELNYQPIGSGGGIAQIKAKTVNFGASDAPLEAKVLEDAGLIQFPMTMGGVIPVVNIEGVNAGDLKMSSANLALIYLGEIKKWNDPRLTADNPGLKLPDAPVKVVHRSDGSGTTWIYTNYLSKVLPEWKDKVGNGTAVSWPCGDGGKGNAGVAALVKRYANSIGYVEYAYCLQNKMANVLLQNAAGKFMAPTAAAFAAAASHADWEHAEAFYMVLTNQPGDDSWPIAGATFILLHKTQADVAKCQEVLKFWDWCYSHPQPASGELDYVPVPENVVKLIEASWSKELHGPNGESVWPIK